MTVSHKKAQNFLEISDQFRLGHLITERPHPATVGLSQLIKLNPTEAIQSFLKVDKQMLEVLVGKYQEIHALSERIQTCFKSGGRVFLSGCGATGRLSLVIENLWRQLNPDKGDQIVGLMAGGDLALIHSIEKFEDYSEYGVQQLKDLGFSSNDLLLASTEGGETPWVIGTALASQELGGKCTFLFCNPPELLREKLERCRQIFDHEGIEKLDLTTGPQALTGSTRLQASSILTAAIGTALFQPGSEEDILFYLQTLKDWYLNLSHEHLIPFIQKEASIYNEGKFVYYTPSQHLAISVLTDTTERSPTFNLRGFDNEQDQNHPPSWCYLAFPKSQNSNEAWEKLLYRAPRALKWPDVLDQAGHERLLGFNFSREVFHWRSSKVTEFETFNVWQKEDQLLFELGNLQSFFPVPQSDPLGTHLILKMLLNMHSTLVMGLMGRYESNVMTYVRPSNNKLIDRCVRYADQLLKEKEINISYEALVDECFKILDGGVPERPIVLQLVQQFSFH